MAYKKIHISEAPKQARNKPSRFEGTAEWQMMKADIERGLKHQEALQLSLTDEDKKKYKIKNRRTVARFLQKYLRDHKLPYRLKSFRFSDADTFIIQNPRSR